MAVIERPKVNAELPLDVIGSMGPLRPVIGVDLYGELVYHDRVNRPHLLVSGESRMGKGGTIRVLQANDVRSGTHLIVLEPKPAEFGWLDGPPDGPAVGLRYRKPEDISQALHWGAKQARLRQDYLEAYIHPSGQRGVDHFRHLPEWEANKWPLIVFYVDEMSAIFSPEALLDYSVEQFKINMQNMAAIVKRGASAGVLVVAATQYPTLESMFGGNSPLGGGIRANMGARIHLDRNQQSLMSTFDSCGRIPPRVLKMMEAPQPGRGGFVYLREEDGGTPGAMQAMWLEPDVAYRIACEGRPEWARPLPDIWKKANKQQEIYHP